MREGDKRVKIRRIVAGMSLLLTAVLCFNPMLQKIAQLPEIQQISSLSNLSLSSLPKYIRAEEQAIPAGAFQGLEVSYKLFGVFPIKSSEVQVMPSMKLWPCGHSIGVSLQTKGVMVVGQAPVIGEDKKKHLPGREAGIEIGDTLLKIDNQEVHTDQEVAEAIHKAGETKNEATLLLRHKGEQVERKVKPILCMETGRYRIGLYVRDEAAGVGTLTFMDSKTTKFGALGHVINDADTNQKIEISGGKVIASLIQSIDKGRKGHPGEKIGSFLENSPLQGTIEKNTGTGIYGAMNGEIRNPYFSEPIPVAWASEIQEGPAKIYTVLSGEKIEEFEVSIEKIMSLRSDSKNMIIRVTDPRLIQETGGIIQGMSGSPIVQNGKIIGAVTHVFVNDSLRGYGVFIQNMLKDAGMLEEKQAA